QWLPRMLKVLEAPELAPRYAAPDAITDMELAELTDVAVTTWGVMRTRQQAMDDAQRDGWPVTAVNTPADLLEDPHFRARGYWQSIDHPVAGKLTYPGPPMRWPDGGAPLGRAPLLDEQGEELRAEA